MNTFGKQVSGLNMAYELELTKRLETEEETKRIQMQTEVQKMRIQLAISVVK